VGAPSIKPSTTSDRTIGEPAVVRLRCHPNRQSAKMALYRCDGCDLDIAANMARIHCQQCPQYPGYDMCANCTILGTATGTHLPTHQTILFRTSGFGELPPAPPSIQPPPQQREVVPRAAPVPSTPAPPAGWAPFFDTTTWQPTTCYMQLMAAIFERLDPARTGYVSPEAHSSLLDVIDAPPASTFVRERPHVASGAQLSQC
jgi:hypothetical protein